ncbi:MAG: hypothetical protein AAGF04_00565 [Chlamydiota bacterium]
MVDDTSPTRRNPMNVQQEHIAEFHKGEKLFKDALESFENTDVGELHKRREFKEVMDQAMQVMSQTAKEACQSGRLKHLKEKLDGDFQNFHKHLECKDQEKVSQDCDKLRKDLEEINRELKTS